MSSLLSRVCLLSSLSLLALFPSSGRAQTAQPLGPADFAFFTERFDPSQQKWVQQSPAEQAYFFNRARCECDDTQSGGSGSNYAGYFRIVIQPTSTTSQKIAALLSANAMSSGIGRLYVGTDTYNCLAPSATFALQNYCTNLLDPAEYSSAFPLTVFLNQSVWESPPIPVARLFNAITVPTCGATGTCDRSDSCHSSMSTAMIYFWAQTSAGTFADTTSLILPINLNGTVSLAPPSVRVKSENEALVASWTWPSPLPTADPNVLGVQLFCQRGADRQVFSPETFKPAYLQSSSLCPSIAPAITDPTAFSNQDASFLCSGLLSPSTTSYRINGLQNGIWYGVGIAVVDKFGNVGPIAASDVVYGAPAETADDGQSDSGALAEGGGCTIVDRRCTSGALVTLTLMGLATLLRWQRR